MRGPFITLNAMMGPLITSSSTRQAAGPGDHWWIRVARPDGGPWDIATAAGGWFGFAGGALRAPPAKWVLPAAPVEVGKTIGEVGKTIGCAVGGLG